jgi:hypothetical protein
MSLANSMSTWRQMPQGAAGRGPALTTAHATGWVSPAATITATADLSAQRVAPYVAFSTLHPA